jgi:hypothetical protein
MDTWRQAGLRGLQFGLFEPLAQALAPESHAGRFGFKQSSGLMHVWQNGGIGAL